MNIKERIIQETQVIISDVITIRRHFHKNPELSFQEYKTSEYIQGILQQEGIPFKAGYAETGVLAWIEGDEPDSRTIALRADMDALPVTEDNKLEFCSTNKGVMHACGHDVHMAVLLGAAKVLNALKTHFSGRILLLFQPGEELLPGGAKKMMDEGVFETYQPEAIYGLHVLPEMETGNIGFKSGIYMASADEIYLTVKGIGGHGALQSQINDTVLAASSIIVNMQQVAGRASDPKIPTVLSFGKLIADGATNIVPSEVHMEGTLRTFNEEWRAKAHELIERIAKSTAEAYGCQCDVNIVKGYPNLFNNPELTEFAKNSSKDILGHECIEEMDIRMTAEDFGWYSQKYPVCFYRLGVKSSENRGNLHSAKLLINEDALKTGVISLVDIAISRINTVD